MAIRCRVYGCKFNNHGWCTLDYIEIDEHGKCEEILPKEPPKFEEGDSDG